MNRHLDDAKVGDLLWLPNYGDASPVWLVLRLFEVEASGRERASVYRAGRWMIRCVEFVELEECDVHSRDFSSLNMNMRIM